MSTRKHVHEENFAASPNQLFALLHTPSAIRDWWSASRAIVIPEVGGTWAATWGEQEDEPDYAAAATILHFEAPRRMVLGNYQYHAKAGKLPFEADFVTEFLIIPLTDGTILRVTQDGFPMGEAADAHLAGCVQGWKDTFQGIRRFLGEST